MAKRLLIMGKKSLHWLILPLGLGLSGFLLLRRKSFPISKIKTFDKVLAGTPYRSMLPFVLAQSQLESANFTSNLFTSQKNAFGMKNAFTRSQLGFKVPNTDFRGYSNLSESVEDFVLWLRFTKFPVVSDVNTYVRNLKARSYFEEDQRDYINALNSWL